MTSEEEAKRAWLARLEEEPRRTPSTSTQVPASAAPAAPAPFYAAPTPVYPSAFTSSYPVSRGVVSPTQQHARPMTPPGALRSRR
eukprot:scaffold280354_cov22-Tisochrysis_lutea.AAC.1